LRLPVVWRCIDQCEVSHCTATGLSNDQRDLEIQDFHQDGDARRGLAHNRSERFAKLLDGYKGRLGIHGPVLGFSKIDSRDPLDPRGSSTKAFCFRGLRSATRYRCNTDGDPFSLHDLGPQQSRYQSRAAACERHRAGPYDTQRCPVKTRRRASAANSSSKNIEDKDPMARVAACEVVSQVRAGARLVGHRPMPTTPTSCTGATAGRFLRRGPPAMRLHMSISRTPTAMRTGTGRPAKATSAGERSFRRAGTSCVPSAPDH